MNQMSSRNLVVCLLVLANTVVAVAEPKHDLKQPDSWFESAECRTHLKNVLSHQDKHGCWPKNGDTTAKPYKGDRNKLTGTFDNGATVNELRFLARAFRLTKDAEYKNAFDTGLNCILDAQYDHGGWPQYPHPSGYGTHITFNDGTIVGLMTLLREIAETSEYDFVEKQTRQQASSAFDKGVACILACQIKVNGKLTVWCAQHDSKTFEPKLARSYEHPSLSGGESAAITTLLMSLEQPSPEVVNAIRGAVEWYERSELKGVRYIKKDGGRRLVRDPKATTLWARFYEIETNRPIFSGRDGVIKYDVSEIEAERRNGYSWYVNSGKNVASAWAKWKKKHASE